MTDHPLLDIYEVFDREYLARNFSGPPRFFEELLEVYLPDALLLTEELIDAHAGSDASSVVVAAHKLKGASASVGAFRVTNIAQMIEHECHAGDFAEVGKLLRILKSEVEAVRRAAPAFTSKHED